MTCASRLRSLGCGATDQRVDFVTYLWCGDLSRGFLRTRCADCALERLVPFSCKARAVCPSCSAKRSAARTAHLVDAVLPDVSIRQWVQTLPFAIRGAYSLNPTLYGPVNRILVEEIARHHGRPRHQRLKRSSWSRAGWQSAWPRTSSERASSTPRAVSA
ncbi:MAG: transposase zinc-binding domain-containing protein [Polyangiaceae bacterium]|nr:transposase zinc-binding domain-containing protein [Polyangiaceae bacterium]MCB9647665.1 transposase zinc-binding domain-containing protein [Deltaproteobacteria bacterium]